MIVAQARAVTRNFGSFTAVDRVDLDVSSGEIVGLLGANGAGKTTLIKMLLGLLAPTSGSIALFGEPQRAQQRRRIGYVAQNLGLYPDLTVAENLEFRAQIFGTTPSVEMATGDGTDLLVRELPLGMQRRASFTVAIQHRPDLLILDEPTSGVSPLARSELWDMMRREADRGAGVLVSTHYMDEAVHADRLLVMAGGSIVAAGSVGEIIGSRRTLLVRTDRWAEAFTLLDDSDYSVILDGRDLRVLMRSDDDARAVIGLLEGAGVAVQTTVGPATLDETMVELST